MSLERSISLPILTTGLNIPSSSVVREYYITITSTIPFTYSYNVVARSRIGLPIGMFLFVVGIIVTVVGVVLKESGSPKALKRRSWQEPTLGGSANSRNSKTGRTGGSSRSGSGGAAPVKVSSAVKCKKCGGVMPRNSQYCPHCYAKQ